MRPVCACSVGLSLLLTGGLALHLKARTAETPAQVYADPEAYKVYAAVLPIDSWYWESSNTMLILRDIPPREWPIGGPRGALRGNDTFKSEFEPIFQSFDEANRVPMLLNSDLDLHRAHRFVTTAELDAAFAKGGRAQGGNGWEGFRQRFPNSTGYVILSVVGFNSDRTKAVVYVEHRCGNLCGEAHFYVLQKRDGLWVRYFPSDLESEMKGSS